MRPPRSPSLGGTLAAAAALALALAGPATANVILQGVGDTYVAFEAEDFYRLAGSAAGWRVVDTTSPFVSPAGTTVLPPGTNASGNTALLDDFPDPTGSDHESTATYLLRFKTPGSYRMYVRESCFESGISPGDYGNEDSYYRPSTPDGFDTPATVWEATGTAFTEGTYGWRNTGDSYTVTAGHTTAPFAAFHLDDRERGYSFDRVVFSTTSGLSGAQLDALTNSATTTFVSVPFLYYPFEPPDTHTDGTATDYSGHFRNGSFSSTGTGSYRYDNTTSPALLRGTQSLELVENGDNHGGRLQRSIPSGQLNLNTQSWSFSGWFNRRDSNNEDFILHMGQGDGYGGQNELHLYAHGADALSLWLEYNDARVVDLSTPGVPPDEWHHVALIHDAARHAIELWLDGARVGVPDTTFTLGLDLGQPVVFGGHRSTSFRVSRWFDGHLDDLALFDFALSTWQVRALAGGAPPLTLGVPEPGTLGLLALGGVALWRRRRRQS